MFRRNLYFNGLASWQWTAVCAIALLASIVMIVILLRYERRLVPRKVGWTLLLLRFALIAVVFLTFLEPVLSWTLDRERTGRIVVAVDLSESMAVADEHAAPIEKLRWARALGLIGNDAVDDRVDEWEKAFAEGREPEWVDENEKRDAGRAARLAAARKENVDRIFKDLDGVSRKEIVRRLLTETSNPLLDELEEVANVDVVVFSGRAQSAEGATLEQLVTQPPAAVLTDVTDLSQGLAPFNTGVAGQTPLIGVVLLTDGRDNAGRDPVGAASRLGFSRAPVYAVLVGSELRPKDIAIASVDFPQTAFKQDRPILKATINISGFENRPLTVVLEEKGKEPVSKTVQSIDRAATVEFDLDAETVGRREYTLRTDVQEGETRDDNNEKSFAMNVVDDKVRVLLLEGEARWEFRFIDNALMRDERVEVKKVVFDQPYMGVLQDTFFPRTLDLPEQPGDLANSPFAEPDLVIIGDVSPAGLPDNGWKLLEKYVAESGGTLVMIAGKNHMPLGHRSEIVARLLPMTNLQPTNITGAASTGSPRERGFHLHLTTEGVREPMLHFDADPAANQQIWQSLPGFLWGLLGEAKPGATVLAYAALPDQRPTLEAERKNAVIAHQHYGFGQVLWIGVDSTWRWRHRAGDRYHHRFWGQVGRWAADNRAAAGNEVVKFGPDRSDIEVGEDAVIRARWTQQFLKRHPELKAKAQVSRIGDDADDRPFSTIELVPEENRPLQFEGRLVSLPSGQYRVRLVVDGADVGDEEIEATLYVHEPLTLELSDLSANRDLLDELANVSRGRVFYPDEVHEIPKLFEDPKTASTTREEKRLWDKWYMLVLFFGLLTSEWVVRKLNGLP